MLFTRSIDPSVRTSQHQNPKPMLRIGRHLRWCVCLYLIESSALFSMRGNVNDLGSFELLQP
jgi:hypothetical protein